MVAAAARLYETARGKDFVLAEFHHRLRSIEGALPVPWLGEILLQK